MGKFLPSILVALLAAGFVRGQDTYLQSGSDEQQLLERMEGLSGTLSGDLFLNVQPVSRRDVVLFLQGQKSGAYGSGFSNSDNYNINRAISLSGEWLPPNGDGAADSRHSIAGIFYRKQPDLIHINKPGFFLAANPVLGVQGVYEKDKARNALFNTTQGAELRGRVMDRVGLYFFLANNYEEPLSYVRDLIDSREAIPGAGDYTRTTNGYRYLQVRGYADVGLIRDHINLTLGYDRHFIGDGYRSLFLSDFADGAAFARINTRIWKLNYQNLYLMLRPQQFGGTAEAPGYKYATAHYLSLNLTRWLNIGFFESVTFSRGDHFEFGYLNPVIFYRAIERGMGSPDKVSIGFNAKALVLRHFSLYTQLLINEFTAKELFAGNGYWANKWGIQLGARYFNAFGISDLDLQGELNVVRPYTYQHYASVSGYTYANYTHGNQPLAHPLGAGFAEVTGNVRYQPLPGLSINGRAMYYRQGIDTAGSNNGSNILLDYNNRSADYGVKLIHGPEARCMLFNLNASYELRPRLYIDIGGTYRKYTIESNILPGQESLSFTAGLRLNLARRDYAQF